MNSKQRRKYKREKTRFLLCFFKIIDDAIERWKNIGASSNCIMDDLREASEQMKKII